MRHLILSFALLCFCFLRAEEVQKHGLVFEQWIRDTFFEGYKPSSPTQKWDITAEANRSFGGIPVNPKATKFGTPVDLGDALRQYEIQEPFLLIVGYWKQEETQKRFVNIVAPRIEPEAWRKLWGPVTLADLQKLDATIKDRTLSPAAARTAAFRMKAAHPFTKSVIQVNPKIDEKGQRRLQCSLRFEDLFDELLPGVDRKEQVRPMLWGTTFPGVLESAPRSIPAKPADSTTPSR